MVGVSYPADVQPGYHETGGFKGCFQAFSGHLPHRLRVGARVRCRRPGVGIRPAKTDHRVPLTITVAKKPPAGPWGERLDQLDSTLFSQRTALVAIPLL